MGKAELNSILFVNLYLTNCKIQRPGSVRTEMVRKYLSKRINNALNEKSNTYSLSKTLILGLFFINLLF